MLNIIEKNINTPKKVIIHIQDASLNFFLCNIVHIIAKIDKIITNTLIAKYFFISLFSYSTKYILTFIGLSTPVCWHSHAQLLTKVVNKSL